MKYISDNGITWNTEVEAQQEDRLYAAMKKGQEAVEKNMLELLHSLEEQFSHIKVEKIEYGHFPYHAGVKIHLRDTREQKR